MCADIHDGQEHKRSVEGRIQKRKTNHLQIITFGLQRTAGPYKGANSGLPATSRTARAATRAFQSLKRRQQMRLANV